MSVCGGFVLGWLSLANQEKGPMKGQILACRLGVVFLERPVAEAGDEQEYG